MNINQGINNTINGTLKSADRLIINSCFTADQPGPVKLEVPNELSTLAKESIGSYVSLSGKFYYDSESGVFPSTIKVRSIEIIPINLDPVTLMDIRGIAPDATGDKSSEQFIRDSRDLNWGQT